MLEIISGLNNVAVSRLKKTWRALPSKSIEKFKELELLMDNQKNYSLYRSRLSEVTGTALPYFGN